MSNLNTGQGEVERQLDELTNATAKLVKRTKEMDQLEAQLRNRQHLQTGLASARAQGSTQPESST